MRIFGVVCRARHLTNYRGRSVTTFGVCGTVRFVHIVLARFLTTLIQFAIVVHVPYVHHAQHAHVTRAARNTSSRQSPTTSWTTTLRGCPVHLCTRPAPAATTNCIIRSTAEPLAMHNPSTRTTSSGHGYMSSVSASHGSTMRTPAGVGAAGHVR